MEVNLYNLGSIWCLGMQWARDLRTLRRWIDRKTTARNLDCYSVIFWNISNFKVYRHKIWLLYHNLTSTQSPLPFITSHFSSRFPFFLCFMSDNKKNTYTRKKTYFLNVNGGKTKSFSQKLCLFRRGWIKRVWGRKKFSKLFF